MQEKKNIFQKFPGVYWLSIFYEFVERGAYYGVMSILSVYLVMSVDDGGLGFSKIAAGGIKATIQPIIYALPIFSGALADRFGYRKTLMVAFSLLGVGYLLTSQATEYTYVFLALIVMSLGAGTFKPVISGTIARVTDEKTSTLGFGIFYWSINLGAFIFPLILVPWMKNSFGWNYVFVASGIAILLMIIPNIVLYKEPEKPKSTKNLKQIFVDAILVLKDYRFVSLIVIYSGFWILYFQMFDTVLWYLTEHMDMAPVNAVINAGLTSIGIPSKFVFSVEHITVINAGTIIALQLIISNITKNTKALPTMITGIFMGTLGMAILALTNHPWVLIGGIILFSVGEMTTHPKFISYVGLIAPKDKVATYMGYSFLYGVIGSGIGCMVGPFAYGYFITQNNNPSGMWMMFSLIGVVTIIGLLLYNKFLSPNQTTSPETGNDTTDGTKEKELVTEITSNDTDEQKPPSTQKTKQKQNKKQAASPKKENNKSDAL